MKQIMIKGILAKIMISQEFDSSYYNTDPAARLRLHVFFLNVELEYSMLIDKRSQQR